MPGDAGQARAARPGEAAFRNLPLPAAGVAQARRVPGRLEGQAAALVGADRARRGVADQHDVEQARPAVHNRAALEIRQRPGPGPAGRAHGEHIVLGPVLRVRAGQGREHQVRPGEIVAVHDARAVVAPVAGVERQHGRAGMAGAPAGPGLDDQRARPQPQPPAPQRAGHRLAGELAPQAVRFPVEHQLVGAVQQAGGPEHERLLARRDAGLVQDARTAERAVGERDRDAAHRVVHHLVPAEDAQRVGPRVAGDLDAEHRVVVVQVAGVGRRDHAGVVERGDAVRPHAAPDDLLEADVEVLRPAAPVAEEAGEAAVDPAEQRELDVAVARMGLDFGMRLQPQHGLEPAAGGAPRHGLERRQRLAAVVRAVAQGERQHGGHVRVAAPRQRAHRLRAVRAPAEQRADGEVAGVRPVPFRGRRGRGGEERQQREQGEERRERGRGAHGGLPGRGTGIRAPA